MTKVVFLLVPQLHLLDLAGPAQAFGTAADLGCGYELTYVAETENVPAAQGVTLRATTQWPALTADDLVIIPGWRSSPARASRRWWTSSRPRLIGIFEAPVQDAALRALLPVSESYAIPIG